MAADLIIYAIVAGVLVFWLKNILGTKNGSERDRPNPFAPKTDAPANQSADIIDITPQRVDPRAVKVTKTMLMNRVHIENDDVQKGLERIAESDPHFNLDRFMEGAEYAFELIVTSFAKGDRDTLRKLLIPSVYNDFDAAITARMTRGETCETRVEAVPSMDIMSATIRDGHAYIAVRFTAQETCLIRNAANVIIAGEVDKTTTMIDIWTFGREVGANDPTWFLYETRDEQPEPHKTPMPESYA